MQTFPAVCAAAFVVMIVFASINLDAAAVEKNEANSWTEPTQLPGFTTYFGIEATTFQDRLAIAWVPTTEQVYYAFYDGEWTEPRAVPDVMTDIAPSIIEYRDKLYMVWPKGGDIMWFAYYTDDGGWTEPQQVPGVHAWSSPALAVLSDRLVAAWLAHNEELYYIFYDEEKGWSEPMNVPTTKSISAPALVAHDEKIYLSWASRDFSYWYSTLELGSEKWTLPVKVPEARAYSTPYMTSTGDELFLTWLVRTDLQVYYSSFDGSKWSPAQVIPTVNSDAAPSIEYYEGKLYSFWTPDSRIFYSSLIVDPCASSIQGPAINESGEFESKDQAVRGQISLEQREITAVQGQEFNVTITIVSLQGNGFVKLLPSYDQSNFVISEPEYLSVVSENGREYSDYPYTFTVMADQSGNFTVQFSLVAGSTLEGQTVVDECGNGTLHSDLLPIGDVHISIMPGEDEASDDQPGRKIPNVWALETLLNILKSWF